MKINLIVALCKNNGIGISGSLPWCIKEDMQHFYRTTIGEGKNAVVMGRKTWESLNGTPLRNRFNFVLTRDNGEKEKINSLNYNNLLAFCSVGEMLNYCNFEYSKKFDVLWVIGGNQIYKQFIELELCGMYVITIIDKEFTCDTFFPDISDEMYIINEKKIRDDVVVKYLVPDTNLLSM